MSDPETVVGESVVTVMDWVSAETKFVEVGKVYGYKGPELAQFVQKRLEELEARQKRAEERVAVRHQEDVKEKAALLERELEVMRVRKQEIGDDSSIDLARGKAPKLDVPKFKASVQTVAEYFDLFEAVMEQNHVEKEYWHTTLRTAVVGSNLYEFVVDFSTYAETKSQALLAYGSTASSVWQELMRMKQGTETFHQFCVRVTRKFQRWAKLAMNSEESQPGDKIAEAIVRQLVTEAVDDDVSAYLLQTCKESSMEAFVEAGGTYQVAHGRSVSAASKKSLPSKKTGSKPSAWSAQCLAVSTEEASAKLKALPLNKRREFLAEQKMCFNCLQTGHKVRACKQSIRCEKCAKRHHSLIHDTYEKGQAATGETQDIVSYQCLSRPTIRLMTAVAEVKGATRKAKVRVFIDSGSQASFMSSALVKAIQPKRLRSEKVRVTSFGGNADVSVMNKFEVTLTSASGEPLKIAAYERPSLELGNPTHTVPEESVKLWRSRGVELSDQATNNVPEAIHLLIGADCANNILLQRCEFEGEHVWKSELGWILCGPVESAVAVVKCSNVSVGVIQSDIQRLWEAEEPIVSVQMSQPAFPLRQIGQQYEAGLLWKSDVRPQDNKAQAEAMARQLVDRLERKGERAQYDSVLIQEYSSLNAIEQEPKPESPGYYLPHHAVIREDAATTKVRVVFNASAAVSGGRSLNDVVDPGPSLLPDLCGMLLRFREFACAFQADIRKAFFMIGVQEEDRPYLRFVWPDSNGKWCVWRLTKLPFGVNCSPYILTAVLQHHLTGFLGQCSKEDKHLVELLLRSLYVDDCLSSLPDSPEVEKFQERSTNILMKAGMELRKWRGNTILCSPEAGSKVLGVGWSVESDRMQLAELGDVKTPLKWSRRSLLKCVASVFDPLGLASPLVLPGKMLLQKSWRLEGEWDDDLPAELDSQCSLWWGALGQLPSQSVDRWVGFRPHESITLHVFCDASETGYGCCIYGVSQMGVQLLLAKAKVAPLSPPTLARLELMAVGLGARRVQFVVEQLRVKVVEVFGWTDSLTTWYWINGPPHKWKTFVANRVIEVQAISKKCGITWCHCPGTENPADVVSRGCALADLPCHWVKGPQWLSEPNAWPRDLPVKETSEAVQEVRVAAAVVEPVDPVDRWWLKFSEWRRVHAVTQVILSWRYRSLSKRELSKKAEAVLCRVIQREVFAEEYAACQAGSPISKASKLSQCQPFVDSEGVLRATRRLQFAELPEESKAPIVLAAHPLTKAYLRMVHQSRLHQGVEGCLTYVRRRFHLVAGRRLLRSVKKACVTCKRHDEQPATEVPAPLPKDRVVYQRPFAVVGIDHAGPVLLKNGQKSWILLYVCATTRAVHLDLVTSLSAQAFLLSYRQFVALYGDPSLIRSDNGAAFTAAARHVSADWRFNPPASPWHGGFFERLVAVVKSPLRRVLGKALVTEPELRTLLAEIQYVVNDRPLTYVGDDDSLQPLTPNALVGRAVGEESAREEALDVSSMNRRINYLHQLQSNLRNRWQAEYLLGLRAYHSHKSHQLRVGSVVLLVEDGKKRADWRMAKVVAFLPGRDSKQRVARISLGSTELLRPVQRLIPLEVVDEQEEAPSQPQPPDTSTPENECPEEADRSEKAQESDTGVAEDRERRFVLAEKATRTRSVRPSSRYL